MVKIWEIFLFVSTKYTYVTNGRKDRQTDRQTNTARRHSIARQKCDRSSADSDTDTHTDVN